MEWKASLALLILPHPSPLSDLKREYTCFKLNTIGIVEAADILTGENVETTTATLVQVHSLGTGMKSMGLTVEQISSHVGTIVGHISALTESHSDMHSKADHLMDLEKQQRMLPKLLWLSYKRKSEQQNVS